VKGKASGRADVGEARGGGRRRGRGDLEEGVAAARLLSPLPRHGCLLAVGDGGRVGEDSRNGRPPADRDRGRWRSGLLVSGDGVGFGAVGFVYVSCRGPWILDGPTLMSICVHSYWT
jgi:hypothetical protein